MVWRHGQVPLIKLFGPKIIKDRKFLDWELHDLVDDPYEEHNLATSRPELVSQMAKEFVDWAHAIQLETLKN